MTSGSDFAIYPLKRCSRLSAPLGAHGSWASPGRQRIVASRSACFALLSRGGCGAAMGLRPARRVMHELLDLGELGGVELAALLGDREHVPPGRQRVQRHAEIAQDFTRLGKNVVEEEHQRVLDLGPGLAQRGAEI